MMIVNQKLQQLLIAVLVLALTTPPLFLLSFSSGSPSSSFGCSIAVAEAAAAFLHNNHYQHRDRDRSHKQQYTARFLDDRLPSTSRLFRETRTITSSLSSTTTSSSSSSDINSTPVLDDIPQNLKPLFDAASNSTSLRGADTSNQGHDSFRYEWGTWVDMSNLEYLMEIVDRIRLSRGSYDNVLLPSDDEDEDKDDTKKEEAIKYRLGSDTTGGSDWDCWLHVLPEGTYWEGRQPTGSWSVVKALSGTVEIKALTQSMRVKTKKELMGGNVDGPLASEYDSGGEDCVKYVGGPLRRYEGKYGNTVVLEVVVRPPIGKLDNNNEGEEEFPVLQLRDLENVLSIVEPEPELEESELDNNTIDEEGDDDTKGGATTKAEKEKKKTSTSNLIGVDFEQVGGLDNQLNAIARRVLASRANPVAAKKLGISHVRGILLSGPPGCGKTLLARELARLLGAREPQIVNGPEILDKYIGEAEKKVRELFAPAEREYRSAGDKSALHIIILDEMDAIARKRGTMTSDTTGVRDSVVNQLLAKMDGVQTAPNILVVGLTNRPELLDPALLRPGRLEVQLRVELPDLLGRRDILAIHTRQMRDAGALRDDAVRLVEDDGEKGLAARTEHYSGAELAGLVRSAASFALARALEGDDDDDDDDEPGEAGGVVTVDDIKKALGEVRPALGKQDETLKMRYPLGISPCSASMERVMRDLERFASPIPSKTPQVQSLLLVGAGGSGGAGVTALAAWSASGASERGDSDYVRFVTALDLMTDGAGSGDGARAAALVERFAEAREMSSSLLVLDDVDQLCAGDGANGYSSVMIATLRALLRSPPASTAFAGANADTNNDNGILESASSSTNRVMHVIAATSRTDAACRTLHEVFDETIVVPLLEDTDSVETLLSNSLPSTACKDPHNAAKAIIERLGKVGCKTALRLAERAAAACATNTDDDNELGKRQLSALSQILDDLVGDEVTAQQLCEVM